jgi:diguanylate cyclase
MSQFAVVFNPGIAVMPAVIAVIAALAVFLTGFRLTGRARETTAEGGVGWMLLGSVAHGSGIWACGALTLISVAGPTVFRSNLLVTGLFLAIASTYAGFVLKGRSSHPARALLAGLAMSLAVLAVSVTGLASIGAQAPVSPWVVGGVMAALSLAGGASHSIASARDHHRAADIAALVMAPAVVGASTALILTAQLGDRVEAISGTGTLGAGALAAGIAVVLFIVVTSGMATALIHRDAEFTSQARLKGLAEASVEGLAIVDGNGIVDCNETLVRLLGRDRDALIGQSLVGNLLIDDAAAGASADRLHEAHVVDPSGRQVPVEVMARPVDWHGRRCTVHAIRDLSDRRDAELRIRYLAEHDVLTGLPNRAAFQAELDRRCQALRTSGAPFSVLCIDLDHFKEANDVFGHRAGDEVLIEVGDRLRAMLPPDGFAARLGGDEFVVIAPDLAVPHAIGDFAERVVDGLSAAYLQADQRIVIGSSVGVAVAPGDGDKPELLLARADMALYRAKQQGRGAWCFFEVTMDEETRVRRALAFELRSAIDGDRLELAFQPLVDLSSGDVTGFEALVRWTHPVHGTISPAIFVGIAEESGFITRFGEWVLRTATAEAASWHRPLTVAVNLSPLQLEQQSLPDVVHEALVRSGLSPSRLELEVTEAALVRNPQRSLDILRRLKALGVKIAMDDFGTGASSLSVLQSFPFDKLKIDRSFVDRVDTQGQAASIVRAVVGLSRSLQIRVVAEGVETEAQKSFLTDEACDEVQGFMMGKPLPISEYAHLTGPDPLPPKSSPGVVPFKRTA